MDELVRWFGEQLDEDERIARRAGDSFRQIGETGVIVATEGDRAEECASANWTGIAEHIVRHDPARVLREIEAKRDLLRLAERAHDYHETFTSGFASALEGTLRLFALAYADRPGYREEWAP
jgi:hypothetical protein